MRFKKLSVMLILVFCFISLFSQNNDLQAPENLSYEIEIDYISIYWEAESSVIDMSFDFNNGLPWGIEIFDVDDDGYTWEENFEYGHLNTGAMLSYSSYEGNTLSPQNWMIMRPVNVSENSRMIFKTKIIGGEGDFQDLKIMISTIDNDPIYFEDVIFEQLITNNSFEMLNVDLSEFAGSTIFLAFIHGGNNSGEGIVIDDVWFTHLSFEDHRNIRNPELYGFNIYRNSEHYAFTTHSTFFEWEPLTGITEYYVTSVYNTGESDPSESIYIEYGYSSDADESFEDGVIPEYWRVINNGTFPFWKVNRLFANTGEFGANITAYSPKDDWLITPQLQVFSATDSLIFFVTCDYSNTDSYLNIKVSTTGNNPEDFIHTLDEINMTGFDWQKREYSLEDYIGEEIFIAFQFIGYDMATVAIDDVSYPTLRYPNHSIAISDLSLNPLMYVNQATDINFTVKNMGTHPIINYTVYFKEAISDDVIAQYQGGFLIPGQTQEICYSFVPHLTGDYVIYAETNIDNDPYTFDDKSQDVLINVVESDDYLTIANANYTGIDMPFNMLWHYSLTQTIYPAQYLSNLSSIQPYINGLIYYYEHEFNPEPLHISVWIGETNLNSLENGWIPSTQLQNVFNGYVSMHTQDYLTSIMKINFESDYQYQGGNLVIMTYREDTRIHIGHNSFIYSASENNDIVSIVYVSDDDNPDPANPPISGGAYLIGSSHYPNLTLVYNENTPLSDENHIPNIVKNSLNGNYPNPFNPTTNISFSISNDSPVRLDIYNVKGQLINTLVNQELRKGNHTIQWDGKDKNNKPVSSGVYFSRIKTNDFTESKKMLLLK